METLFITINNCEIEYKYQTDGSIYDISNDMYFTNIDSLIRYWSTHNC